jgi:hypothetical protein
MRVVQELAVHSSQFAVRCSAFVGKRTPGDCADHETYEVAGTYGWLGRALTVNCEP